MSGAEAAHPRHWCWRSEPNPPGPAVIFDIDGVLADATGRQHFLEGDGKKDWKAFFDACGDDPPIEEVARLLDLLEPGLTVVLLTGRPVRVQGTTRDWLDRHGVRWDVLVMRDSGNYATSPDFKRRTVTELRALGYEVRLAFEDDHRNRDMFHDEGVPCVYIHSGYYG